MSLLSQITSLVEGAPLDSKRKEIKAGDRLLWVDENGEHTGRVEADPKYNGGLRVGGRSVKNIIDDSEKVTVLEGDISKTVAAAATGRRGKAPYLKAKAGEKSFDTFADWKAGVKKECPDALFYGNSKSASAHDPESEGQIAEWDGSLGVIFKGWNNYMKEDAALQGLGKGLAGKSAPAQKASAPAKVPAEDASAEPEDDTAPSDTPVKADPDEQATTAEFKVGDVVKPLVGPHKGEKHDVSQVLPDGRLVISPQAVDGQAVKYRNGKVYAKPDQVVLSEGLRVTKGPLFKSIANAEPIVEAAPKDGIMPLSYKAGKGHTIEAYGRKGMKNSQWRKCFKDQAALEKWCEIHDATVEGTRELDADEIRSAR